MKKTLALMLSLLLLPTCALAQETLCAATVVAGHETALVSAASGRLADVAVRAGDQILAGETVFSVEPVRVYADQSGVVAQVNVAPGDIADAAVERYGAAVYIDPENRYEVRGSVRSSRNTEENRDLHVGTPVFLRSADREHSAGGVITAVDGLSIAVQVLGGDLVYTQRVNVYRGSEADSAALLMENVSLSAVQPSAVSVSGTVVSVSVARGDAVRAGDELFSYVPDVLEPKRRGDAEPTAVKAGETMILTEVRVEPGAAVQKDQVLALACPADALTLLAYASEEAVSGVSVGDAYTACFEEAGLGEVEATVTQVSWLSQAEGYAVYLAFDADAPIRLGMHATLSPASGA